MVDYNRNILLVYKTRLGFSMHFFFKRNGISAVPLVLLNTSMRPKLQNDVISTYNCSNLLTFIDVGIYLFTKLHATVNFYIVWYVSTYENCKFLFIYFLFFRFWLLICCFVSYHKKKTFVLSCWCDYILVDLYSAAYVIMYLCFPITLIVTCLF